MVCISHPNLLYNGPKTAGLIYDGDDIPVACQLHGPELYLGGDDAVLLGVILLCVQTKERRKTEEVMNKDRLLVQCKQTEGPRQVWKFLQLHTKSYLRN